MGFRTLLICFAVSLLLLGCTSERIGQDGKAAGGSPIVVSEPNQENGTLAENGTQNLSWQIQDGNDSDASRGNRSMNEDEPPAEPVYDASCGSSAAEGEICFCSDKATCEAALANTKCKEVRLAGDVRLHGTGFVEDAAGFSNKTFDCQGHRIYRVWEGEKSEGAISAFSLNGKRGNTIKNCIIDGFHRGIVLEESAHNSICNVSVSKSAVYPGEVPTQAWSLYGTAVLLSSSAFNRLIGVNASFGQYGILMNDSHSNLLLGIVASNNTGGQEYRYNEYISGINMEKSNGNILRNIKVGGHGTGGISILNSSWNSISNVTLDDYRSFWVAGSCKNDISDVFGPRGRQFMFVNSAKLVKNMELSSLTLCDADNAVVRNITVEGEPVGYYKHVGGVYLISTDNASLEGLKLRGLAHALSFESSNNNTIAGVEIKNTSRTIELRKSSGNVFSGVRESVNDWTALAVYEGSMGTVVSNSSLEGIYIREITLFDNVSSCRGYPHWDFWVDYPLDNYAYASANLTSGLVCTTTSPKWLCKTKCPAE